MTSVQNVRDKPNSIIEKLNPESPIRSTGLRPIRSDRRDQWKTVSASVAKKSDWIRPA